jgi:hypothetical protein
MTERTFSLALIWAVLVGAALFLGGCETVKAISDACRDGLCR